MKTPTPKDLLKVGLLILGSSLLLWNCQKESETVRSGHFDETISFLSNPTIETFTLNELKSDQTFTELKNTYRIFQIKTSPSSGVVRLDAEDSIDDLDVTIDPNSIKRITSYNYTSYSMLMIEPEDKSGNFSNLVIQEHDGKKEIFTVRYFPKTNSEQTNYLGHPNTPSYSIQIRSGVHSFTEIWDDPEGNSGSGGYQECEEYQTVCHNVVVYVPIPCPCRGHMPGDYCTCPTPPENLATIEEICEDVCMDYGGGDGGGGSGGGGGGGSDNETEPADIATIPINPDGSIVQANKPCPGDPLKNMEITSSGPSGKRGGTFGCTRIEENKTCDGIPDRKRHKGIDITAPKGTAVFATHSGKIIDIRNTFKSGEYKKYSFGNYVTIQTNINGNTRYIKYNHLDKVHVQKGKTIAVGDIIGSAGKTGNAAKDEIIPHIDVQLFDTNWKPMDPIDLFFTKFDNQLNSITQNCN